MWNKICPALFIIPEDVPTSLAVIVLEFTSLAVSISKSSLVGSFVSLFERMLTSVLNLDKESTICLVYRQVHGYFP